LLKLAVTEMAAFSVNGPSCVTDDHRFPGWRVRRSLGSPAVRRVA